MRSQTDLRDVLEMAAKSCRRPLTACQIYFSMTRLGRKVAIFANPDFVSIEIRGQRSGPAFCIGQADKISYWEEARQHVQGPQRLPVYVPAGTAPSKKLEAALNSKILKAAFSEVLEQPLSKLHLYRDQARL